MRLAKFAPINIYLLPNIINGRLHFSAPKDFNDPYEGVFRRKVPRDWDSFNKWHCKHFSSRNAKEDFENIETFESTEVQRGQDYMKSNNGICCFTIEEKKTDILMWAHYGNDHQGVCLIFDMNSENDFFQEGSSRVAHGPESVQYIEKYLDEHVDSKRRFTHDDFWTSKFKIWQTESEFRFLATKCGSYPYKKCCLKEIVFGYRVEQLLQETVISYIKSDPDYHIQNFYKVKRASGKFSFALKSIE